MNFVILPKNISVYFVLLYLLFHNFHMKVGHLNAQFLVTVRHLKTFFAQGVENLISQISKSSNSRGRPGGGAC